MTEIRRPPEGPIGFADLDDFEDEVTSVSAPPTVTGRKVLGAPVLRDRAALTLVTGPSAGAIYTLLTAENFIGRGKECSVRIDDPGISRRHARVNRTGPGTYVLEDLASRNGTFANGVRIAQRLLAEGDRIGIGPTTELRFGFTDEAEEGILRRLYESSVLDALTGAFNRKHFAERLTGEIAYAKRHGTHLSLVIFDLDHFKRVNDTLGHLGGDHVLRSVAGLVKRTLRAEDVFARYGGEEFAVIARGIDVERAFLFAERIRNTVVAARIEFGGTPIPVTVSAGVASLACVGPITSIEPLVAKADERLYAAKRGGRNRTVGR